MRRTIVSLLALSLSACASAPDAATAGVVPAKPATYCDPQAVTGTRLKRCDKIGVQTLTRDEIEAVVGNTRPDSD